MLAKHQPFVTEGTDKRPTKSKLPKVGVKNSCQVVKRLRDDHEKTDLMTLAKFRPSIGHIMAERNWQKTNKRQAAKCR